MLYLSLTFDSSRLFFAIIYNCAIRYSSTVIGRGMRYSFINILHVDYDAITKYINGFIGVSNGHYPL